MDQYARPYAEPGGLRLHLNENTAGCSPAVLEAIGALTGQDVAFYPEYDEVHADTARAVGVDPEWLALTNGLDEGILVTLVAAVRDRVVGAAADRPEVLVPQPAFDMYAISASAVGASVVEVPPRADFSFQADEVIAGITHATRVVYVTSPNNPTGIRVPLDDIDRIAAALPPEARLFVDEAYHDFCGDTALPLLAARPNVIVGRTFAKAHGMAALRAGCLVAQPRTLAPIRRVIPPYSLNIGAAVGLRAALADRARLEWYVEQVRQSRERAYAFCRRHGLEFWESGANFVLMRIGARAGYVVEGLAARGIFIRDRSRDAGCDGCIRITTGVVEHTDRCLAVLEAVLCDVQ